MTINDEERMRRHEAVTFARANVELEGFKIPPDEIARMKRFVNGELTLSELLNGHEPTQTEGSANDGSRG
ncbi:antitoxin VbhA family protein [Trinickia sp. NRRL B-1857]|uniref:antitoxin VbhA family protein n=1 Tax=Trinickia sp. NRRL B-1857 TaxID=3162879 RepID=UPI003D2896FA